MISTIPGAVLACCVKWGPMGGEKNRFNMIELPKQAQALGCSCTTAKQHLSLTAKGLPKRLQASSSVLIAAGDLSETFQAPLCCLRHAAHAAAPAGTDQ